MKTLIVYYSFTGNNESLAKELRDRLGADLFRIETRRKTTLFSIVLDLLLNRTPEIKDFYHARNLYDKYIFISPVWAGRVASPMRAFLRKERLQIRGYSFITLCGGGEDQKARIYSDLVNIVGQIPEQVVELQLKEFFSQTRTRTSHKFEASDLKFFKDKMDVFVRQVNQGTPALV
jgi:flavodoxin